MPFMSGRLKSTSAMAGAGDAPPETSANPSLAEEAVCGVYPLRRRMSASVRSRRLSSSTTRTSRPSCSRGGAAGGAWRKDESSAGEAVEETKELLRVERFGQHGVEPL